MYLKSLQIRGFKSFADRTQLDFEPGITVIVGPNGSGKSNIVDALTWSMGTRSAKDLRGGSMADVIFAGARSRKAMGRAAVQITIDNEDGSLPIEFSEVTVGRSMFASGENAYSINDVDCRQLDVAELLSDTGLGRETHTIVGQGRIDAVLNARPEERRAFIEEAAGILKHRRRKERALRKLTQMDGHLERLVDVLGEMRRQLRPLERQAEAAQKHKELSDRLRMIRRDRALRELAGLLDRFDAEVRDTDVSDRRLAELQQTLQQLRDTERDIGRSLGELSPAVRSATETQFALANLAERASGIVERIIERRNGLTEAAEEPIAGRPPAELRDEADRDEETLGDVRERVASTGQALQTARTATQTAEHAQRAHEQAAAAEARRAAEARERQIRWEGEIATLRSALGQANAELGRLDSALQAQDDRAEELEADATSVNDQIQRLDALQPELSDALDTLRERRRKGRDTATAATRAERELERRRASLEARADALFAASAEPGHGAEAVIAAVETGELRGVLGPLASLLQVDDGFAVAVSAALGPLADAVVVQSRSAAQDAIGFVTQTDAGRALLLVAGASHIVPTGQPSLESIGALALIDVVDGKPAVAAAVKRALAGAYVCDDFDAACRLADSRPDLFFVTRDGQTAGSHGHAGGGAAAHSAVLSRAAAEEAQAQATTLAGELSIAHRKVGDADRAVEEVATELQSAQAAMQESDAQITAAADRWGRLRKELARCEAEQTQLTRQHEQIAGQIEERNTRIATLEDRGPVVPERNPEFADIQTGDVEAERLTDRLVAAREAEVQARLASSSASQEAVELSRRIDELRRQADQVEAQLAERQRRQDARLAAITQCDGLEQVARQVLATAQESRIAAAAERDRLEEQRAAEQRELGVARSKVEHVETQVAAEKDSRHREDLIRQELSLQITGVRTRLRELQIEDPEDAIEQAGPELLDGGNARDEELEESEDSLSRKIGLLGTVNPLALEEFHALQERHGFMTTQLEDLRSSKADLLRVVDAVDGRIREVFAAAFVDVAHHFERIFPKLFPGGSGRLILTDPDDMLLTGVEVQARPPGKKVKRLSLLSGGERSLTALAVLFAIFAARPSPFYVLDEVEAALDDANLGRFLGVLSDFRGTSQWIIVSHQRRTMEVADTVYGVSMASDGISKVVSTRLDTSGLVGASSKGKI